MQTYTPPQSPSSYLAREDFWHVGDEAEIGRRYTGCLFTQLCFPVKGLVETVPLRNPSNAHAKAISPKAIGLVVTSREEIGMPKMGGTAFETVRQRLHEQEFGTELSPLEAVIQAAGILVVTRDPQLIAEICSKSVQGIAADFAGSLEAMITPAAHQVG